jgi:hypothetical protein
MATNIPPNIQNMSGPSWVVTGGGLTTANITTANIATHPYPASTHTHSLGTGRTLARYGPSHLDKMLLKMTQLHHWSGDNELQYRFRHFTVEEAVQIFGDYNPIYAGKPKKLAYWLLNGAAGRTTFNGRLIGAGLAYATPSLIGVRKTGTMTSYVGLGLLDHWAEKFPRFKPFVDAFVTSKMRRKIASDCYDFSLGVYPKDWRDAEVKNKELLIKWEAREYRKMKKQEAANKELAARQQAMTLLAQQGALNQQYAAQQMYRTALGEPQSQSQLVLGGYPRGK